jgi:hypothetical protein
MLFVTLGIERMFEVAVSAVFVGLGVVLWAFIAFTIERYTGRDVYHNIFGLIVFGLLGYLTKVIVFI